MQVVGPTRFYCIVDGCTKFMMTDDSLFCDGHRLTGPHLKFKGGLTADYFRKLIKQQREDEAKQDIRATATITSTAQANRCIPPFNYDTYVMQTELMLVKAELAAAKKENQRLHEASLTVANMYATLSARYEKYRATVCDIIRDMQRDM